MSRAMDFVVSTAAVILLSPMMAAVAVVNWALTRRVLYRQIRVGRGLRRFTMLKFQTMVDGPDGASTVTVAGDRRLTRAGRVLRAVKLDELPQFINVMRGEMSLVGPRALTPNEVARIPGEVAARVYSVRPGMTGLASLVFSDEERILARAPRPEDHYYRVILPQKMALESLYVQRKTLWLDLVILMMTPAAILLPSRARAGMLRLIGAGLPGARAAVEGRSGDPLRQSGL